MSDEKPFSMWNSIKTLQSYAVKMKVSLQEIIEKEYKVDDNAMWFFEGFVRYLNEMVLVLEEANIKAEKFDLLKLEIEELYELLKKQIEAPKWLRTI